MKPLSLRFEGINSFIKEQNIDFSHLFTRGMFGIFGPTGVGKSTILEAMVIALFGGNQRNFINTQAKKNRVELTIEIDGCVYRIERNFFKNKDDSAVLYQVADDGEKLIAESKTETESKLSDIIRLTREDFQKCIALPQGDFASFLNSPSAQQINIIARLFNLTRYGDELVESVRTRFQKLERQRYGYQEQQKLFGDATKQALESNTKQISQLKSQLKQNENQLKALLADLAKTADVYDKTVRLNELGSALDRLQDKKARNLEIKEAAEKAKAARVVLPKFEMTLELEKQINNKIKEIDAMTHEHTVVSKKAANHRLVLAERDKEYQRVNSEYEVKRAKLSEINLDLWRLQLMEDERVKLEEQHALIKKEFDVKYKELSQLENLLISSDNFIGELLEQVDMLEVPFEKREALARANEYEVNLRNLRDQVRNLQAAQAQNNSLSGQAQAQLAAVEKAKNSLSEKIRLINSAIATESGKGSSTDILLDAEKKHSALCKVVDNCLAHNKSISKLTLINESFLSKVSQAANDAQTTKNRLRDFKLNIQQLQALIDAKNSQKEELIEQSVIAATSNALKIGENCPVCSQLITDKRTQPTVSFKNIENEIAALKIKLEVAEKAKEEAAIVNSTLQARSDENKRQIDINIAEIKRLKQERDIFLKEVADVNGDDNAKLEEIKNLSEQKLVKLRALFKNLLEQENEFRVLEKESATLREAIKQYGNTNNENQKTSEALAEKIQQNLSEQLKYINALDGMSVRAFSDMVTRNNNIKQELIKKIRNQEEIKLKSLAQIREAEKQLNEIELKLNVIEEKGKNNNVIKEAVEERIFNLVPEGSNVEEELKRISDIRTIAFNKRRSVEEELQASEALLYLYNEQIAAAKVQLASMTQEMDGSRASSITAMISSGFVNVEDLRKSRRDDETIEHYSRQSELELEAISKIEKEYEVLSDSLQGTNVDIDYINAQRAKRQELSNSIADLRQMITMLETQKQQLSDDYAKVSQIKTQLDQLKPEYESVSALYSLTKDNGLLNYLATEYLGEICAVANDKLAEMTSGRYILSYNTTFTVTDNFNGGIVRDVSTLSGGETFIVSLALALSLSESIMRINKREFEFFFLDEGFETLDSETMEVVFEMLSNLQTTKFNIGIITHMAELQSRIESKLIVERSPDNKGSIIKSI